MTDTLVEQTPVSAEVEVEKPKRQPKAPKVATPCACSLYTGQDGKGEALSTDCEAVTVRTFAPGHDAKLKSLLIKTAIAGEDVVKIVDGVESEQTPVHAAEDYGFRSQVEKGLAVHKAKEDGKLERAAERQRKADERKAAKDAAKAERKAIQDERKAKAEALKQATDKANAEKVPGPATAKVGREKYDGEVLADGTFRYVNGAGEQVETENYTIVVTLEG